MDQGGSPLPGDPSPTDGSSRRTEVMAGACWTGAWIFLAGQAVALGGWTGTP